MDNIQENNKKTPSYKVTKKTTIDIQGNLKCVISELQKVYNNYPNAIIKCCETDDDGIDYVVLTYEVDESSEDTIKRLKNNLASYRSEKTYHLNQINKLETLSDETLAEYNLILESE